MQEQKINRREILKTLVMLSIPTILEEILSTLLQYVDTAMVGHLGEKATASVSVTTTVTWLVNSIPAALGVAVLSMTAKALGSGDREYLQKIAKQILILVFACGLFAGGISVILSPYIPIWMGAEPSIWQDASDYFLIVSLPMIFRSATMIMGAAIRGTKDTKTPMLINLGANGTNILLNIVFIYGMGLGVRGAAIAISCPSQVNLQLFFKIFAFVKVNTLDTASPFNASTNSKLLSSNSTENVIPKIPGF